MLRADNLIARRELRNTDLVPPCDVYSMPARTNTLKPPYEPRNEYLTPLMPQATMRSMALKTMGCKSEPQSHLVIRRPATNASDAWYPQPGAFRHEKKGLAFDPRKPTNLPIMPISNNFFAGENNRLTPLK